MEGGAASGLMIENQLIDLLHCLCVCEWKIEKDFSRLCSVTGLAKMYISIFLWEGAVPTLGRMNLFGGKLNYL